MGNFMRELDPLTDSAVKGQVAIDWLAHYRENKLRLERRKPLALIEAPRIEIAPKPYTPTPGVSLYEASIIWTRHGCDAPRLSDGVEPLVAGGIANIAEARALVAEVAASHGFTVQDISGPRRFIPIVKARDEAVLAVHRLCPHWSLPQLGRFFGRDHTTVLHSLRKFGLYPTRKGK